MFVFFTYLDEGALCPGALCPVLLHMPLQADGNSAFEDISVSVVCRPSCHNSSLYLFELVLFLGAIIVRNKGDDKEYRRLNAAFQRIARQDKEQSIKEKCRQIEESNKMGRTRDLYREIKDMTGSYSSRCGAMTLSTGKVVTEGKEVKEIWQQYTEELYRRDPNATDSFNENIYEDEPEVM